MSRFRVITLGNIQLFLNLALLFGLVQAKSSFKFTNIKCLEHDVSFSRFEICRLKVVGRDVVSLNIKVRLYKSPVTNSTVNLAFYKKSNGFKPFLYNGTADVCAFFANRQRYPIFKIIFDMFVRNSNLNHTCPYSDVLAVEELVLNEGMFRYFPLSEAEYLFKAKVYAYNDLKATLEIYFYRKD
ncbi:uncharacterized protein LOC106086371 [Stomoxys calcitrans]|uniref:MD-2-related lipid-recognition domain-containing protein n=1 Tax=Stomoxys calcitrans TaxID=35570 RepID=A0A1I8Q675_STOCA|nr:uncharacterized protein LOC106086371 [Stomoxys calcitrans]